MDAHGQRARAVRGRRHGRRVARQRAHRVRHHRRGALALRRPLDAGRHRPRRDGRGRPASPRWPSAPTATSSQSLEQTGCAAPAARVELPAAASTPTAAASSATGSSTSAASRPSSRPARPPSKARRPPARSASTRARCASASWPGASRRCRWRTRGRSRPTAIPPAYGPRAPTFSRAALARARRRRRGAVHLGHGQHRRPRDGARRRRAGADAGDAAQPARR